MAPQFVCDLSITNPHSQLSQLFRNHSLTENLPDVWLVQLLGFLGAEVWDNRGGNRQAGSVRVPWGREAIASTEITCLSPKAVKAVDLCSLHLLFIFFRKIEQVGDNLKQNGVSVHELECVTQELLTPLHEVLEIHGGNGTVCAWHLEIKEIFFLRVITEPAALYKQKNPNQVS